MVVCVRDAERKRQIKQMTVGRLAAIFCYRQKAKRGSRRFYCKQQAQRAF